MQIKISNLKNIINNGSYANIYLQVWVTKEEYLMHEITAIQCIALLDRFMCNDLNIYAKRDLTYEIVIGYPKPPQ